MIQCTVGVMCLPAEQLDLNLYLKAFNPISNTEESLMRRSYQSLALNTATIQEIDFTAPPQFPQNRSVLPGRFSFCNACASALNGLRQLEVLFRGAICKLLQMHLPELLYYSPAKDSGKEKSECRDRKGRV